MDIGFHDEVPKELTPQEERIKKLRDYEEWMNKIDKESEEINEEMDRERFPLRKDGEDGE